jgi:hypothetical protein
MPPDWSCVTASPIQAKKHLFAGLDLEGIGPLQSTTALAPPCSATKLTTGTVHAARLSIA